MVAPKMWPRSGEGSDSGKGEKGIWDVGHLAALTVITCECRDAPWWAACAGFLPSLDVLCGERPGWGPGLGGVPGWHAGVCSLYTGHATLRLCRSPLSLLHTEGELACSQGAWWGDQITKGDRPVQLWFYFHILQQEECFSKWESWDKQTW